MTAYVPNEELERKTILRKYKEIVSYLYEKTSKEQRHLIRKAFLLAVNAHKDMRRRSGEPYIYHPLEVARIVSQEMNLGTTSVVCALLHDVVEDTDYTLDDIRDMFGDKVAKIIDGLTKIDDIVMNDEDVSVQAENFRKIFLSMVDDVRVILIKLADRLHNMRTLDSMPQEKQFKIASETTYFYAPIAHRLGLYAIKSELEDYAMQYTDPMAYKLINDKIASTAEERQKLIDDFLKPILQKLDEEGIKVEVSSRTKSIYSIYQKMIKKKVDFDDIYDVFAVRFVFDSDIKDEMRICWAIYTIVTSLYKTNASRERNFLINPKPNGYQSLHVTAMSNSGRWIEVQIRSKRMDEIAEKGFAAHYKYKEENRTPKEYDNRVEEWLMKIRDVLKSDETNALDFLNEIKLNLDLKEVIVFTPKGDMKVLVAGATVLDLAYDLHTELGNKCIGAKVNYNIVPANYVLRNGDQVEIITSKRQSPKPEWMEFVKTSRAKECIKEAIREEQKKYTDDGMKILQQYFDELHIEFNKQNIARVQTATEIRSAVEFWSFVASGKLTKKKIAKILSNDKQTDLEMFQQKVVEENTGKSLDQLINEELEMNPEVLMLDEASEKIQHIEIADCCKPIPGDQVVGLQLSKDTMIVHRTNCPLAIAEMSKHGNRIIKAKWRKEQNIAFLSGIKFEGFDKKGLLKEIVDVVSSQMDLNMRALHMESKDNIFRGTIMLYIGSVKALETMIEKLSQIDNITSVSRIGF